MISQRIKELRSQNNISQKELSSRLFVSPQAISKWERNEATPNPEAIAKMATIFNVSADYLLGLKDQKEAAPAPEGVHVDIADVKAAFFQGADPTLTEEERDALWEDARSYMEYKLQQRSRGKPEQ